MKPAKLETGHVRYEQSSGAFALIVGGCCVAISTGSAGSSAYRNNPDADTIRNHGPLPKGNYRMGVMVHPRFAAPAIRLSQETGKTHGRSGFFIHGGTKSEGCILLQRADREFLAGLIAQGVSRLEVVR